MPRLVVTMPAFNAALTIRRAVTTTLRAMPADSELLVLDDKSTDNTLEVLEGIADGRLRIIAGEHNVGGGNARSRLLAESDSEYVASMDADDISFPWRFWLQLKALRSADVVFSSAIRFGDRAGLILPSAPTSLSPKEFPAALLFHCPVWQSSLFARRSAIDDVDGYQPLRFAQDYDLWLRIAKSGARMRRLSIPVIAYRESPTQVTRSNTYLETVRRDEHLRRSYAALFNSRVESVSLDTGTQSGSAADIIRVGLVQQLPAFRFINRVHFSHFLRSNQSHTPFTV